MESESELELELELELESVIPITNPYAGALCRMINGVKMPM